MTRLYNKGIWEFPINSHYVDEYDGGFCPYLDQCVLHNTDANDVLDWLKEDFSRSYDQNRAPYSMAFHTSWFQQKNLVTGLSRFIDWLLEKYAFFFARRGVFNSKNLRKPCRKSEKKSQNFIEKS